MMFMGWAASRPCSVSTLVECLLCWLAEGDRSFSGLHPGDPQLASLSRQPIKPSPVQPVLVALTGDLGFCHQMHLSPEAGKCCFSWQRHATQDIQKLHLSPCVSRKLVTRGCQSSAGMSRPCQAHSSIQEKDMFVWATSDLCFPYPDKFCLLT